MGGDRLFVHTNSCSDVFKSLSVFKFCQHQKVRQRQEVCQRDFARIMVPSVEVCSLLEADAASACVKPRRYLNASSSNMLMLVLNACTKH